MRAHLRSRGENREKLKAEGLHNPEFGYTSGNRTEDRATLESDPSAEPGPGLERGCELPPNRHQ